jgi:hypothetical protein
MSGILSLVKAVYDRVLRPFLPRKIGVQAGIAIRKPRLLDATDTWPNHGKRRLIKMTRDAVSRGDHVVVVGGGEGLSPTAAAQSTGPEGHVDIYEASERHAEWLEETLELNVVAEHCSVHHAIVGEALDVMGDMGEPDVIDPADLPVGDVLELDCEGAELAILSNLSRQPETVLVETHPRFDSPTEVIRDVLLESGYEIVQTEPEPVAGDILLARHNDPQTTSDAE